MLLLALLPLTVSRLDEDCMCSSAVKPVCDTSIRRNYTNVCWARCAGVSDELISAGTCAAGGQTPPAPQSRALTPSDSQYVDDPPRNTEANPYDFDGVFCFDEEQLKIACSHLAPALHHEYMALYFMFFALSMGALSQWVITRYMRWAPYTCLILVEGIIVGFFHELGGAVGDNTRLGSLSESIEMWMHIDPHLLLFTFLPALLYSDAMSLDVHLVSKSFKQCLLLAVPGVILGAGMLGVIIKVLVPYGWDWSFCFALGSILAATDPVAVVALLNDAGVSPKLTMLMSGESLLNDGMALVCFNIFSRIATGYQYTAYEALAYGLRLALGGPALGALFGLAVVWFMGKTASKWEHTDVIVQITYTWCCAYLSFAVGEGIAHVSGVLCCVTSAFFVASLGWPIIVGPSSMKHVWHAIEFWANTLLFMLAGILTAHTIASPILRAWDVLVVIGLYLFVVGVRFVIIFVFYPLLSRDRKSVV